MKLTEQFLGFIWRFRLLLPTELPVLSGEKLRILSPGMVNKDQGPDFLHAKIQLGTQIWVGQVEIHLKSSDWELHGHHLDPAYNSVILHVVQEYDQPVFRQDGTELPALIIQGKYDPNFRDKYQKLMEEALRYPCQKQIREVTKFHKECFLSRILIERLEEKSAEVVGKLKGLKGDWEETFYQMLARNFGFKVNADAFERLATLLPSKIIARHKDQRTQIDALVFGQAGFLNAAFKEEYPKSLKLSHEFYTVKYQLRKMEFPQWKFLRMRPHNFPTVRLAQFSGLLAKSESLFSKVLENEQLSSLLALFRSLPLDKYWEDHYSFEKKRAVRTDAQLGTASIQNILINTICVFLFTFGKHNGQSDLVDRALRFLEEIPAENNAVIRQYEGSGMEPDNAFFSQALLQLNKSYCSQKKCLNCGIGIKILNR